MLTAKQVTIQSVFVASAILIYRQGFGIPFHSVDNPPSDVCRKKPERSNANGFCWLFPAFAIKMKLIVFPKRSGFDPDAFSAVASRRRNVDEENSGE